MSWRITKDDWSMANIALVVVLLVSAVPFVDGIADWASGRPLQVETGAIGEPPPVREAGLAPGVTGAYTSTAVFTISDAGTGQWLAALLVPFVTLLVAAVCLWQVRCLLRLSRRGDPFHPRALVAVRVLSLVLFCYGLFVPLVHVLTTALVTVPMRGGSLDFTVHWSAASWWPVVAGLVVGVVGESVLGRGRELTEDTAGLV
ncbi:DUF2975 domain-containing protein [Intrasporangium sp.]|uniref:DUF2975 domain-containing protein n=1 Tax=Intrasporangium sp. TaxID=1925024 RepID=UPI0032216DA6